MPESRSLNVQKDLSKLKLNKVNDFARIQNLIVLIISFTNAKYIIEIIWDINTVFTIFLARYTIYSGFNITRNILFYYIIKHNPANSTIRDESQHNSIYS